MRAEREWIYYDPMFESDMYHPYLYRYAPWSGLRRFAYDFVRWYQPERIVELGSHYGCSTFAFLQAIRDGSLNTEFFAVDTWAGDDFTVYDHKEDVIGLFRKVLKRSFFEQNVHMYCGRFERMCRRFADASVDILHIDGSHWYHDVKRDYEMWLPKMKPDGVILFHDVGEDLFCGQELGSRTFWMELCRVRKGTAILPFSGGLGLVFMDPGMCGQFRRKVRISRYQKNINLDDMVTKARIRQVSYQLQQAEAYIRDLQGQVRIKEEHLQRYAADTKAKDRYISKLEKRLEEYRHDRVISDRSGV